VGSVTVWAPIIVAIAGLLAIARGLWRLPAARTRRRWREAEGEITFTALDDSPRREFRLEYRYVVAGHVYRNNEILPGQRVAAEPESLQLFHEYPLHRRTTVFYDPDDPTRSALDLDPDELVLHPILLGVLAVVLAAVWLGIILAGSP
jgi:hypothetical protein